MESFIATHDGPVEVDLKLESVPLKTRRNLRLLRGSDCPRERMSLVLSSWRWQGVQGMIDPWARCRMTVRVVPVAKRRGDERSGEAGSTERFGSSAKLEFGFEAVDEFASR
jgi:hypothetical protein